MNIPLKPREKVIGKIIDIPVCKIVPNPNQPRKHFCESELNTLADSIKSNGIIQPLTVREISESRYEIVAGERRYRACIMCGYDTVPCIIMDISQCESAVMALVENIQRKDLNCFDEAEAIRQMIENYGITQEEAASRIGKNQSTIANKLRLLNLSVSERNKITEFDLTERHARALLKIKNSELREYVIEQIHSKNYNVEQTEKYIENLIADEKNKVNMKRRGKLFRHVSLFTNSINHAVEIMRAAGVECESKKINGDGYVEFIVRIPTDNMSK